MAEIEEANPVATTEDAGKKAAAPVGWPQAVEDRYKHAVLVGKGMFGKVYAAWDSVDEQLVAVKQLSSRTDGELVVTGPREFEQEVAALTACRGHPNVVNLLTTVTDHDGRFIVTEFAGPVNLRRYVQQRHRDGRPFSEDEVRNAMAQIISGVACAHKAGVLHREVVPENVIVDEQQMKVTKKIKQGCKCKYTICGFNASERARAAVKDGTAHLASSSRYRAPELFLSSGVVYDERIDVWGLGCIMAELLAGEGVPFFSRGSEQPDLNQVLQVVGGKGLVEWPGLQKAATPHEASDLREKYSRHAGHLRLEFSKGKLSQAGFDVLSGLLQSNPESRLTAEATLEMPWFHRRRHRFGACLTS